MRCQQIVTGSQAVGWDWHGRCCVGDSRREDSSPDRRCLLMIRAQPSGAHWTYLSCTLSFFFSSVKTLLFPVCRPKATSALFVNPRWLWINKCRCPPADCFNECVCDLHFWCDLSFLRLFGPVPFVSSSDLRIRWRWNRGNVLSAVRQDKRCEKVSLVWPQIGTKPPSFSEPRQSSWKLLKEQTKEPWASWTRRSNKSSWVQTCQF